MNKKINKRKKGFTLIELIIVLAIMAIIAAIAIPNFTSVKEHSKSKTDVQSCEMIKRNMMTLIADETIVPSSVSMVATYTISSATVTGTPDNDATAPAKDGFTSTEKTAIHDALASIKAPQAKTAVNYRITFAATSGDVTVATVTTAGAVVDTTIIINISVKPN